VLVLDLLYVRKDLDHLCRLFKVASNDSRDVPEFGVIRLVSSLDLGLLVLDLPVKLILNHIDLLSLLLQSLLSGLLLHKSPGVIIIVMLELLELSPLLEEGLRSGTALIFKDLLLLKIGSFGSRNELISVVLVSHLEMVKGVSEGSDLLLTFPNLAIQFISLPLELFLLLSGFDDIVSL
jgi:hypothetical protein